VTLQISLLFCKAF